MVFRRHWEFSLHPADVRLVLVFPLAPPEHSGTSIACLVLRRITHQPSLHTHSETPLTAPAVLRIATSRRNRRAANQQGVEVAHLGIKVSIKVIVILIGGSAARKPPLLLGIWIYRNWDMPSSLLAKTFYI